MATVELDYIGPSGERGDSSSVEIRYWIDGATDLSDALGAMLASAPPRLGGLVITSTKATPETDSLYQGSVTYGTKQFDESSYSFEIGVASTKITQSLQTMGRYARPGKTASNLFGAIGVTKDGVEGTDVSVPTFGWTETHYFDKAQMSRAYFFVLFNLTARMNADAFRGFDPGEVLLIGVNGSASPSVPKFQMTFKFLASPNSPGGSINSIAIGPKFGHDYLWVRYQEAKDSTANAMIKIPYEVFVERVYQIGAYSLLNLEDPF